MLLSDRKKVDVIKKIQQDNNETNQIVYFGDGLTDKCAFEYVHSIGGTNVFISSDNHSNSSYETLNANGIINKKFDADFGKSSPIRDYIQTLMLPQYDEHEK